MLNARRLGELLTRNTHPELYQSIFVMSPNGTLVAYSTPANMKQIRDQASLISMAWKDTVASTNPNTTATQESSLSPASPDLKILTVQFETHNVVVYPIQATLLLVLVGEVAEDQVQEFKMAVDNMPQSKADSAMVDATNEAIALAQIPDVLYVQRMKALHLSDYIRDALASRSFSMPEDSFMSKNFY